MLRAKVKPKHFYTSVDGNSTSLLGVCKENKFHAWNCLQQNSAHWNYFWLKCYIELEHW